MAAARPGRACRAMRGAGSWRTQGVAPGRRVLLYCPGDKVWHERLLLWPVTPTRWVIITPDGDLYDEDLERGDTCPWWWGDVGNCRLVPLDGGLPADGWAVFARTDRFRTELSDDIVKQNVVLGKQMSEATVAAEGLPAPPPVTSAYNWSGQLVDVMSIQTRLAGRRGFGFTLPLESAAGAVGRWSPDPGLLGGVATAAGGLVAAPGAAAAGAAAGLAPGKLGAAVPAGWAAPAGQGLGSDEEVWLVADMMHEQFGQMVPITKHDFVLGEYAIGIRDNRPISLVKVDEADAAGFIERRCQRLRELLGKHGKDDDDKDLRKRLGLAEECAGGTAAVEAPTEDGGNPRLWLDMGRLDKGISSSEGAYRQLSALLEAFYGAGTFDQANMPTLVAYEVLARRVQNIIDACAQDPQQPVLSNARFSDIGTAADLMAPELLHYVARRAREEAEVEATRTRSPLPARAPDLGLLAYNLVK